MYEIKAINLVKRFGDVLAVDNLNLSINKGELFGLVGPNSAGKSTTIKMLVGLLKPDRGEIYINDINISNNLRETKRMMGLVPQDIAIYGNMTTRENVEFFGKLYGLRGRQLREMCMKALEFTGLYEKINEYPKTFSGGMKRRLNIACSIVHNPQIVIMDEPTVGIDPQSRKHILDSVLEINKGGSTIIYTSHYMEEVEFLCTRIGIVDHGRIIACGDKNQLKLLISSEEILNIEFESICDCALKEINNIDGVNNVAKEQNSIQIICYDAHEILQEIIKIILNNNMKIINLNFQNPSLENVFLTLTGKKLRD